MITKEDYIDWRQSEVTKEFFNVVTEKLEDTKEVLINGGSDYDHVQRLIGYGQALKSILRLDYEDVGIEE